MSTSYDAGVILGVKLSEIGFNVEKISVPYEIHDKKGKPTGEIGYDTCVKIIFQGEESVEEDIDSDTIEELINIKKPLKFLDISGDGFDINNIIIGINLADIDYNDWNVIKEIIVEGKIEFVKSELKKQFNVDVEPKLYFYFQVG